MIGEHLYDEIPRLLTGEADRATVQAAQAHLRACADCTEELISAVIAHASLTSAARFAPDIVGAAPGPSSALEGNADDVGSPSDPGGASPLLPDMSSMFARVHDEARGTAAAPAGRSRRLRLGIAAAVVAVGVAGAGGYVAADQLQGPPTRTVQMSAFGIGHAQATATLVGSHQIELDASALPPVPAGQYYEVWLTDAARQHMAPVGPLTADRDATLGISPSLFDAYSAIEVSVQSADGTGGYSGVSVLRGSYR